MGKARVPELTGALLPKSLCFVKQRPLLSYQIEAFISAGVSDFLLLFQFDWQIALFHNLTANNFFPLASYQEIIFDRGDQHQLNVFNNPIVAKFNKNDSVFFCHGDTFYTGNLIEQLLSTLAEGKEIVCSHDGKEFLVPVLFTHSAFYKLSQETNLDIQNFLASYPNIKTIEPPNNYINLNTLIDLKKIENILDQQ